MSLEMTMLSGSVTQELLDSLNVEQSAEGNKERLKAMGGVESLAKSLGLKFETGLTHAQVIELRNKFGNNNFPESPMKTFLELFIEALSDSTLLILTAAATVSLVIGTIEHPDHGWIEGGAIFIAIFCVSLITAGNDYMKELQFRALEATSAEDERVSVFREGTIERIHPIDCVVGDILVLQVCD